MSSSGFELAANAAKEIILKMLESPSSGNLLYKNDDIPQGIALADHLGDCFQTLYKKAIEVIKSA